MLSKRLFIVLFACAGIFGLQSARVWAGGAEQVLHAFDYLDGAGLPVVSCLTRPGIYTERPHLVTIFHVRKAVVPSSSSCLVQTASGHTQCCMALRAATMAFCPMAR